MGEEVRSQRLELAVDRRGEGGLGDEVGLLGPVAREDGEGGVNLEGGSHCDDLGRGW